MGWVWAELVHGVARRGQGGRRAWLYIGGVRQHVEKGKEKSGRGMEGKEEHTLSCTGVGSASLARRTSGRGSARTKSRAGHWGSLHLGVLSGSVLVIIFSGYSRHVK